MQFFTASTCTLFSLTLFLGFPASGPAEESQPQLKASLVEYPRSLPAPLAYGEEFFEVSPQNTIRRRFRFWGDYEKELQSYLTDARQSVARSQTMPRKLKMVAVFFKDLRVPSLKFTDTEGQPLVGVLSTGDDAIEHLMQGCREYSDFMLAFTRGEIEVEWQKEVIRERIDYPQRKGAFWPRAISDQLNRVLKKYEAAEVDMWVFFPQGNVITEGKTDRKLQHGGIAYPLWSLYGAPTISPGVSGAGWVGHEMIHQLFDMNLPRSERIRLNTVHGSGSQGYHGSDLGWPRLMCTYRNYYLHLYRRDMWRRFSIRDVHNTPREPFSGKPYVWSEVEHDCWFKLPRLGQAELAKLTGLPSLVIDAPERKPYDLFTVAERDRPKVLSPYLAEADESDVTLNNQISTLSESAAVLRTTTGHWLLVTIEHVDLYVDMLKMADTPGHPLPVYGYVLEGLRPLVLIKAPADLPVPANELNYFRR